MTAYRIRSQSVRVLLRRGPVSVEVVAVLAIEGVLDYGSRGGVNRNSIQHSALSSQHSAVSSQHLAVSPWHLAFGQPWPLEIQSPTSLRLIWGGISPLAGDQGLNAKC